MLIDSQVKFCSLQNIHSKTAFLLLLNKSSWRLLNVKEQLEKENDL